MLVGQAPREENDPAPQVGRSPRLVEPHASDVHVKVYRQAEQLAVVGAGREGGVQILDQPGQRRGDVEELARPRELVNPGHSVPQHPDRKHHTTRVADLDRIQHQPDRLRGGIRVPIGGCGHRKPCQLRRGDLERISQSHELLEAVQSTLTALELRQLRLTDPGQPSDHPQRLAPRIADLPQPSTDRPRVIKLHRAPLLRRGR